jgi:hypothetical protein
VNGRAGAGGPRALIAPTASSSAQRLALCSRCVRAITHTADPALASRHAAEAIPYDESGLEALIFTAEGDMRNALNNLQSTFAGFGACRAVAACACARCRGGSTLLQPSPRRPLGPCRRCDVRQRVQGVRSAAPAEGARDPGGVRQGRRRGRTGGARRAVEARCVPQAD